eukprot:TRINITY_DN124_c0_g2_i1.p3 TRINITY_DN124_c0_g2~~TRINITY_DN124_c0_g2_i1.p3  ORF type:complete len:108 (-),score=8.97 TRINITY_DN124_c0_g2_i1:751-1074(-)
MLCLNGKKKEEKKSYAAGSLGSHQSTFGKCPTTELVLLSGGKSRVDPGKKGFHFLSSSRRNSGFGKGVDVGGGGKEETRVETLMSENMIILDQKKIIIVFFFFFFSK